jgi:CheY-like chemotaxis protein
MAKILIVEDDEIIYKMYQKLLQNHGYDVKIATDGEEGLKIALEEHPDLVLLDIRMPKMDGMTMMHKLREDVWGKKASIIILTNLDATDERLAGVVSDQPSYYLIKANNPPDKLLEKVQEILEAKKKEE